MEERLGSIDERHWSIDQRLDSIEVELKRSIEICAPTSKLNNISGRDARRRPQLSLYNRLGMTLLLDRSSLVDRCVIQTGSWEPDQLDFIKAAIDYFNDPRLYFIDIGAYWGLYSLVAYAAGVNNVIAFEADSYNYSQLQAQFFLNNVSTRIKAHNLAVSDSVGAVSIADSQQIMGGNRGGTGIVNGGAQNTFQVNSITIDKFIPIIDSIIVCKIDVEGHEAQVLKGMGDTIRNNKVFLQIEIFDQYYPNIVQILNELNLRLLHKITVDHYYTNFDDQSLFERLTAISKY